MASSPEQLHKLIKRLLEKTAARQVSWEPSATGNSFRARVGDFVVQIELSIFAPLGSVQEPTLTVTKLDGGRVAQTTSPGNVMVPSGMTVIQPATQNMLSQLWNTIANRDDEISRLIEQLG